MGSSRLTSGPEFSPLPLTLYHVKDTAAPKLASHRLSPLAAGELGKPVVGTGGRVWETEDEEREGPAASEQEGA